ncbi:unnamed protein product [Calypogeia fissa]
MVTNGGVVGGGDGANGGGGRDGANGGGGRDGANGGGGRDGANGGGAGGGDGAGPSRDFSEVTKEVFRRQAGLSAADAEKVVPLLQGLIDSSTQAAIREAEAAFIARLGLEKEKKRKKEKQGKLGELEETLSPQKREKKLRRDARLAERQRLEEEKRKAEDRAKRPKLHMNAGGAPLPKSYNLFCSQLGQVLRSNFGPVDFWNTKKEEDKFRVREQLKECFSNGHFLDDRKYLMDSKQDDEVIKEKGPPDEMDPQAWAAWIDDELQVRAWRNRKQSKRKLQEASEKLAAGQQVDVAKLQQKFDECDAKYKATGEPPANIKAAIKRVGKRPKVTYRMGQGGSYRLKAQFEREFGRPIQPPEREIAKTMGPRALERHMVGELDDEEEGSGSDSPEEGSGCGTSSGDSVDSIRSPPARSLGSHGRSCQSVGGGGAESHHSRGGGAGVGSQQSGGGGGVQSHHSRGAGAGVAGSQQSGGAGGGASQQSGGVGGGASQQSRGGGGGASQQSGGAGGGASQQSRGAGGEPHSSPEVLGV